nr:reverse transcriptase domain-containing protein [Tanacetum cinerariifolium]
TTNLRNEISNFQQRFDESFHEAWDRYKDLLHACLYHGFTKLHQLDTFYNALNPADQDSLNAAAGGNLLERRTQDVLMIIENKSKGRDLSLATPLLTRRVNSKPSPLEVVLFLMGLPFLLLPPFINLEEDERVEETLTNPDLSEYTIKVPPPPFTFPANFVIVDYESDPRVPLILGRHFLLTAHALIGVHSEEMILRNGDERLTLNMRHDTLSYSNQPRKESINLINVFNDSSDDFLEDLFSINQPSGNPTFSSHPELTSSKVQNDIFDLEGGNDSSLKDSIDQSNLANPADNFVDSMLEMFTDEHALNYSSPLIFDEYDDDFLEVESDTQNVYDDPFNSKGEKVKESKLLIDELDLPYDFLPLSEYDSFISKDFSRVDSLPSTNNEDKIFNPGILNQENPFEIITRVVQDKKLAISNASLVLEDFDPPLYEPLFFKEVSRTNTLLPFSSENEEKVFNPGIHTSEKVHSSHILEISHQGYKTFKINQIFKCPMKNFLFSYGKDIHILAVPYLHFYPLDQFKYGGIGSS